MKIKITVFIASLLLCLLQSPQAAILKKRVVLFNYSIIIKNLPKDVSRIKIWIPHPAENSHQEVVPIDLSSRWLESVGLDKKYNNKILFYNIKPVDGSTINISQKYKIIRYEFAKNLKSAPLKNRDNTDVSLRRYLRPNKFVRLTPTTKRIAKHIADNEHTTIEKARAIYDYIWANYAYDKSVPGWGTGDIERFCRFKSGNCTDFHSLFISVANAMGIPAKFVIGFSLPKNNNEPITSYHCWLEFYEPGIGWVPLDISEARKDRTKFDYNFGSVDQNRIEFTHGRDIVLAPPQESGSLNFFIYPVVEVDGKAFKDVETKFDFQDVAGQKEVRKETNNSIAYKFGSIKKGD